MYLFFIHGFGGIHMWKLEDILQALFITFHHVSFEDGMQVIRLGDVFSYWAILLTLEILILIILLVLLLLLFIIYPFIACSCVLVSWVAKSWWTNFLCLQAHFDKISPYFCTPGMAAGVWCSFSLIPGSQSKGGVVALNSRRASWNYWFSFKNLILSFKGHTGILSNFKNLYKTITKNACLCSTH